MAIDLDVKTLRELFRNLQLWQAMSEDHGVTTLVHDGIEYELADIAYLYEQSQELLPLQQRRAIRLCLYDGMREVDAAVAMGVASTNPVAMYATVGIQKILAWAEQGRFPRYQPNKSEEVAV